MADWWRLGITSSRETQWYCEAKIMFKALAYPPLTTLSAMRCVSLPLKREVGR